MKRCFILALWFSGLLATVCNTYYLRQPKDQKDQQTNPALSSVVPPAP